MTPDEEFLEELRAAFQIEASEHLQSLSSGLLEVEKAPTLAPAALIETICRDAHSLKGAARSVDASAIERLCQALEDVFSAWKYGELRPAANQFDALYAALDLMGDLLENPQNETSAPISDVVSRVQSVKTALPSNAPLAAETAPKRASEIVAENEVAEEIAAPQIVPETVSEPQVAEPQIVAPEKIVADETVRISTRKLDELLLQAEEMLMLKLTANERAAALRTLENSLQPWEKEWRKLAPALRQTRRRFENHQENSEAPQTANAASVDKLLEFLEWNRAYMQGLQSQLDALSKASAQDSRIAGSLVNSLLEDTKKLLMLPFSTLFKSFPKLVRDLAHDQKKEVQLVLRGSEIEIDKRILESMKDPLIHLLRNCIDHGIEAPPKRAATGKNSGATLTIDVMRLGSSEVQITVSDDGAGLDAAKIKEVALKKGLASDSELEIMDETTLFALIFQSGFSTSSIITKISGRGLGMAIVREKVEKLGGRLSLESQVGHGTEFRIVLPLTLAAFKGILVRAAGQIFVIPTADVERVVRVRQDEIQTVENRETITLKRAPSGHDLVSLVHLADALELSRRAPQHEGFLEVIVLGAREERIAFIVNEVLNEQEVLVKTLSEPLVRVRNIAGATVLGSGQAVPILNAADLLKSAQRIGAPAASGGQNSISELVSETAPGKAVLVVEDSITARMLLKNILESSGYRVTTAVDGMEALTTLKTGEFDAVVSDVDMPRLNGFDLTAGIRQDKKWAALPVVLVTARESREDRERGVEVGANAYLVKSNFDQSNLLGVLQRLI